MKLGVKFAIAFFISSIISILFIGALSYTLIGKSLQETIISYQQGQANQIMSIIDRFFYEDQNVLQTIAGEKTVASYITNKEKNIPTNASMDDAVKTIVQTNAASAGYWKNIVLINLKGDTVYTNSSTENITKNFFATKILPSITEGKIEYSDILQDTKTKQIVIVIAVPVFDTSISGNPVIGAVVGQLAWKNSLSLLQAINSKTIELYNNQGLLITNNKQNQSLYMKKTAISPIVADVLKTQTNKTIINKQELLSFAVERGFSSYKGNEWVLVVRTTLHNAFAPAANASVIIALLLLPVILFVNGVLLYFIVQLLSPLQLIEQAAEDISRGNLKRRVPHTGNDEIGWLADSFNKMAATLQELYSNLEKKVQDKTKELSEKMEDAEAMNSFMIKRELKLIEMKKQVAELKEEMRKKTQ